MNQSSTPIWIVAAITAHPRIRRGLGSLLLLAGGVSFGGCTERSLFTARVPVLDDLGTGGWAQVSAGIDHTCALTTDGRAYCWGSNSYGQVGVGRLDTTCPSSSGSGTVGCALVPVSVGLGAARFRSISAGGRHTCAIAEDWTAFCWGDNQNHALGIGSGAGGSTLERVPGVIPYLQISAGSNHTCAIRGDAGVYCWGGNERGQTGTGHTLPVNSPVRVSGSQPFASVDVGRSRTCARTPMGETYCWGAIWVESNGAEETFRSQLTPQVLAGAPAFASLSVGSFSSCGLDASGFAYCWDANPRGQMGNGTTDGSTTPRRVSGRHEFVSISAGFVQTCGLTVDGVAYCWGDDSFGQLGAASTPPVGRCSDPSLPCAKTPIPVYGRQRFTSLSTGLGGHTCGVTTQQNLYCWGSGAMGQRGDGTRRDRVRLPVLVRVPE